MNGMQPINNILKRKHFEICSPGPVSSVGDVLTQVRLKHSYPNAPLRWEYSGKELPYNGSNTSDGQHLSFNAPGGPATLLDSNWEIKRQKMINHGWVFDDLLQPDVMVQPYDKATPDYSWNNKIATVNHSFDSGAKFLPLPGGFSGHGLPRGGNVPVVTNVDVPEGIVVNQDPSLRGIVNTSTSTGTFVIGQTRTDPYRTLVERTKGPSVGSRSYAAQTDETRISKMR